MTFLQSFSVPPVNTVTNTGQEDDVLSIQPRTGELRDLFGESPSHSNFQDNDLGSNKSKESIDDTVSVKLYSQYANVKNQQNDGLAVLFHVNKPDSQLDGIVLEDSQKEILSKSWRAEKPDRLSSFKDEYRQSFPIHQKSEGFLQVPQLDELIETMLRNRHGQNMKPWTSSRMLATQPFKNIECLAYHGQWAARMGITIQAYLQQGLGSLLTVLNDKEPNIDKAIQTVRDLFDMSSKAMDQLGRVGAFHHVIRRKVVCSDTGLGSLKDIQAKVTGLPLTGLGVFGKGLEETLKNRKEQKDQLFDLIPELSEKGHKRKFTNKQDTSTGKRQKSSYQVSHSQPRSNYNNSSGRSRSDNYTETKPRPKDGVAGDFSAKPPTFRIPKKK